MSIAIALIIVLLVAGLVVNFLPTPKQTTFLAPGELLSSEETETAYNKKEESTPLPVEDQLPIEIEKIKKAPKMTAKPKDAQHKKKTSKKTEADKK